MARPPLEPIAVVGPRALNISISRDRSPTAPPATSPDIPACTSTSEPSHHPSPRCTTSPSRKRQPSRRQSSISYLPADSPRLWTPRTPQTGSDILDRSPSLLGSQSGNKEGHARALSIPHRAPSEPVVLTLAERHADLLQTIAQKESDCLELRSQLAVHESELFDLKRKWERIVHREFGRNIPPSTSTSTPPGSGALALANTSSTVVLNGLVGGVRALAAVTAPPPLTASSKTQSRTLSSSSPAFAKRMTRQAASISISSSTTTTATSSSAPSTDGSPRLSQSSMSSVAEEKTDMEKLDYPPEEEGATLPSVLSTRPVLVAQRPQQHQQRSPTSEQLPLSPSNKTVRRSSRDMRVPFVDALKPLTGEGSSSSGSRKRASMGAVSPTSVSISGMNPLNALGLGRANLGETAQGWVDSVGSKLTELQKGQTFSKSQKRASVLLSDVSQSIFSALAPPSNVILAPASTPPAQSLIDEDDDAGSTALGSALLPDVVAVSAPAVPPPKTPPPSTAESKEEDDEDWNW